MQFRKYLFLIPFIVFAGLLTGQGAQANPRQPRSFMKMLESGKAFFVNKGDILASLSDGSGYQCIIPSGSAIYVNDPVPSDAKTALVSVTTSPIPGAKWFTCVNQSAVIVNLKDLQDTTNAFDKYNGTDQEAYGD